ncbi:hypothetical protein [Halovivax gelatinilyticus]|uniref:hypothetical protein n=1 Tax=Halovivax gelatinilyticus TaxID=2961597 RepID=UPI0020CA72BB|nr:hypothetical protein [Halovivax gelatinilyticus]
MDGLVATIAKLAGAGTAATLFVATGVYWTIRGISEGAGSEAYAAQGLGLALTFVGWVVLVVLAINVYGAFGRE